MSVLDAFLVADYFLQRAEKETNLLTNFKLQKILYLAHAHHLVECDEPLVHEVFEAWRLGPVLPDVYFKFKDSGKQPLKPIESAKEFDIYEAFRTDAQDSLKKTGDLLNEVWGTYKHMTEHQLKTITCKEGTPWEATYNPLFNFSIPNEKTKRYYETYRLRS